MQNDSYKKTIINIENDILRYSSLFEQHYVWLKGLSKLKPLLKSKVSDEDLNNFENQINFGGYLYVSILDLLTINKNFILSKYVWEHLHQIRLAYLIIYALIETYNKYSSQLKKSSKKNDKLNTLFLEITKDLKIFKKQNGYPDNFIELRNLTMGHIDESSVNIYEKILGTDHMKAYQTVLDFFTVIFKIHNFTTVIIDTLEMKVGNDIFAFDALTNEFKKR
jgi:hypothetical protein